MDRVINVHLTIPQASTRGLVSDQSVIKNKWTTILMVNASIVRTIRWQIWTRTVVQKHNVQSPVNTFWKMEIVRHALNGSHLVKIDLVAQLWIVMELSMFQETQTWTTSLRLYISLLNILIVIKHVKKMKLFYKMEPVWYVPSLLLPPPTTSVVFQNHVIEANSSSRMVRVLTNVQISTILMMVSHAFNLTVEWMVKFRRAVNANMAV